MPKIIKDPTDAILAEAKRILLKEGYDGLNMRTVAKNCGIATGTIYNYYPKKDDLIFQMMLDYWNDYFQVIDKIDSDAIDFYLKLELIYEHFKGFTDDFHSLFLSQNFKAMVATDETRASKMDFMKRLRSRIELIITHHFAQTDSRISPSEASEFILANFIAVSYVPEYSYQQFSKILRALYTH